MSTTPPITPASSAEILVTYDKTGGFAGTSETLTVYADGKLELRGRGGQVQHGQAAPADLEHLRSLLHNTQFSALQPEYVAKGADLFEYEIRIPADGQAKTILTTDLAKRPPLLVEVLSQLNKFKAQVQNNSAV